MTSRAKRYSLKFGILWCERVYRECRRLANLKVEVAISEGFGQKGQIQIPRFESFTPEERRVKIGCSLPQLGLQANRENLVRVALRAEELGYDSVWVLERLLWPIEPRDPYPVTPDGKLPETYRVVLDPLETLTFVAALTSKVKLGTSVLVLPYHTPVDLARRIATLDVLSSGRAEVGVGIGWSRDEFEAAGRSAVGDGAAIGSTVTT